MIPWPKEIGRSWHPAKHGGARHIEVLPSWWVFMSSSYQNDMDDKRCFQRGNQMYNVWPLADEVHGAGLECVFFFHFLREIPGACSGWLTHGPWHCEAMWKGPTGATSHFFPYCNTRPISMSWSTCKLHRSTACLITSLSSAECVRMCTPCVSMCWMFGHSALAWLDVCTCCIILQYWYDMVRLLFK